LLFYQPEILTTTSAGVSEEQIMDIFGRTGQVVGFRLVYDKETGQPKGFGFLEYSDTDSAASAVRNLNDFELNGRTLRVDYSNDNRGTTNNNQNQDASNRAPPPAHFNMNQSGPPNGAAPMPAVPPGAELPPGVTAIDAISKTIAAIPTPQLLDFISQIKGICATNPAQATALFQQAPQLGYAIFQAMLLLGLVDANIVHQLIETTAAAPAPVAQPPPMAYPPQAPPQPMSYPPPQSAPPQQYPPQFGAPAPYGQSYGQTPPVQYPAYAPPPQQAPAAPPQPDIDPAAKAQIMALTPEQINSLPPEYRAQVLQLRAALGM
jgi:cleavage stimulation factor subunit 2